jgi:hypothetical protein
MPRVPVTAPEGPKLAPPPRTGPCYAFSHVQIANWSFLDEKCSALSLYKIPFFLSCSLYFYLLVVHQIPYAPSSSFFNSYQLLSLHLRALRKSLKDFFSKAYKRGSKTIKDTINEEEVKREL